MHSLHCSNMPSSFIFREFRMLPFFVSRTNSVSLCVSNQTDASLLLSQKIRILCSLSFNVRVDWSSSCREERHATRVCNLPTIKSANCARMAPGSEGIRADHSCARGERAGRKRHLGKEHACGARPARANESVGHVLRRDGHQPKAAKNGQTGLVAPFLCCLVLVVL